MGRRWLGALLFLLMGAFLLHLAIGPFSKQTVVTCDFEPQEAATLRHVSLPGALGKIRVQGRLSGDGANRLYHYNGHGTWSVGSKGFEGPVYGPLFLAEDGSVEALSLWIVHPAFGQEELTVATLNGNGILDANRSTAFLFVDPAEKLSHPARYRCRSVRNYDHTYERLSSFNWLVVIGIIALLWAVIFFARRNADNLEFGR
jgi:hypothetical protein